VAGNPNTTPATAEEGSELWDVASVHQMCTEFAEGDVASELEYLMFDIQYVNIAIHEVDLELFTRIITIGVGMGDMIRCFYCFCCCYC